MFQFQHSEALYGLLGLIPIVLLFLLFLWGRKRAFAKLGDENLVSRLMPDKPQNKHYWKILLLCLAFTALVVGIANPQLGSKMEKVKRSGVDVIIAIDVSKSMLAQDIKPDRLERTLQTVSKFIDELGNDRVGLIVFAGNAYLQMPLTIDHAAAKLFLKSVNTNIVPTQGTAIGEAISLSVEAFKSDEQKYKTLVIISDGEDHESDAMEAAEAAAELGVIVHTIGVGSPKGAPIPIKKNGQNVDFKRDKEGSIVLTKLGENMLQKVAVQGGGRYIRLTSTRDVIDVLQEEINGMEKKDFEETEVTDYESYFQYLLALALFFLVFEFFISERKNRWFSEQGLFK